MVASVVREELAVETQERALVDAPPALPALHESWLPKEHSLYRPRHAKRQLTALISAAAFFCVPLLLLVIGVRPEVIENRRLASFPSPANGWEFFTGMNQWATDSLPLRGDAIHFEDWISRNLFGEAPPLDDRQPDRGPIQGPLVPPRGSDAEARSQGYPKVIEGRDGWHYLGYDIQGACRPDLPLSDVITALRRLRSIVEESGRQFVFVVAPDKSTMVPEHLPANYVGSGCAPGAAAALWQRLIVDTGVVDLRSTLESVRRNTGEPIYAKADTHWTYTGGLVMTTAIAERIQPGVTSSWRVVPGQEVTRAGDLPPLIGRHEDYTVRYFDLQPDGRTTRSRMFDVDLRSALDLSQPVTSGVVVPSVVMMADSFTEPALPYLAAGFSNMTVVHTDTVRASPHEVAQVVAAKDVVVFEAVQRSLAGGTNALLTKDVLDALAAELAKSPRR
jgi:alginate O-acetyltransferase complex protein AlgJ